MNLLEATTTIKAHGSPSVGIFSRRPQLRAAAGGIGAVTPLGADATSTWQALLNSGRIYDHARAHWEGSDAIPRVIQLALRAASEALNGCDNGPLSETALVVGTSKGPVEEWMRPQAQGLPDCQTSSPGLDAQPRSGNVALSGLAEIAEVVGDHFAIGGPRLTVSAACASGLHALIRGALMIKSREARRVLVVAAESSLHPLFVASFQRLGVLPPPGVGCRPFDQERAGFVMSEAAAALLLEAHDDGKSDPLPRVYGTPLLIDRMAFAGDPAHLTHSDPEGRVLRSVLRRVSGDAPLDLVHAHGTGTVANDPVELAAIDAVAAQGRPGVYSHKGALGHSLGASGLLAVVLNCLCHRHGLILPNVATEHFLPTSHIQLSRQTVHRPVRTSIALAAGFGGAVAAVRLRSINA